jgi:hypothetical protein
MIGSQQPSNRNEPVASLCFSARVTSPLIDVLIIRFADDRERTIKVTVVHGVSPAAGAGRVAALREREAACEAK